MGTGFPGTVAGDGAAGAEEGCASSTGIDWGVKAGGVRVISGAGVVITGGGGGGAVTVNLAAFPSMSTV